MTHSMLDAAAGGSIATLKASPEERRAKRAPRDALYRVKIALNSAPPGQQVMLASVLIAGKAHAWLPAIFSRLAAVLPRERFLSPA